MKKLLILISGLAILFTGACKKIPADVSKQVTVSAPTITVKGAKYVSLHVGENYSDPGATVIDDVTGASSDITADTSTLDINTPGLYFMTYTAKNANGYSSTAARYIAVTDYVDNINISGTYLRAATGVTFDLDRVARGLYRSDDMGGAVGLSDTGYFAVIDDTTIDFGAQYSETIGTIIYGVNGSLSITATDTSYSYALRAPGYGTQQRFFVKQ